MPNPTDAEILLYKTVRAKFEDAVRDMEAKEAAEGVAKQLEEKGKAAKQRGAYVQMDERAQNSRVIPDAVVRAQLDLLENETQAKPVSHQYEKAILEVLRGIQSELATSNRIALERLFLKNGSVLSHTSLTEAQLRALFAEFGVEILP